MPIPYFYYDSFVVKFEIRVGEVPWSSLYHLGLFWLVVCVSIWILRFVFNLCEYFCWKFDLELYQICILLLVGWSYYFLGSADIKKLSWRPARQFHHYWLTFMVKEGATPRRKVILSPGHEPCSYEPVTPLLCILTPFCCCYGLVFFSWFFGVREASCVWDRERMKLGK